MYEYVGVCQSLWYVCIRFRRHHIKQQPRFSFLSFLDFLCVSLPFSYVWNVLTSSHSEAIEYIYRNRWSRGGKTHFLCTIFNWVAKKDEQISTSWILCSIFKLKLKSQCHWWFPDTILRFTFVILTSWQDEVWLKCSRAHFVLVSSGKKWKLFVKWRLGFQALRNLTRDRSP